MGSSEWKWCFCKNGETVDVSTFGYEGIQLMCIGCGGKIREYEETPEQARCPECDQPLPEQDGEDGPVYWRPAEATYCSMDCVAMRYLKWLDL